MTSVGNGYGWDLALGDQLDCLLGALFWHAASNEGVQGCAIDGSSVRLVGFSGLGLLQLKRCGRCLAGQFVLASLLNCLCLTLLGGYAILLGALFGSNTACFCLGRCCSCLLGL